MVTFIQVAKFKLLIIYSLNISITSQVLFSTQQLDCSTICHKGLLLLNELENLLCIISMLFPFKEDIHRNC